MLNTKRLLSLVTAVIILFSLSSCKSADEVNESANYSSQNTEPYYTFTDDMGNEVVLDSRPKKVAVLFSSFADVWKTAGGEIYVTVGESVERGFASEDVLLVDDGAGKTIDSELLISYEPDLVICSADLEGQLSAAEILRESGVPTAAFHVETFDEYLNMLKICTDITGDTEAYKESGLNLKAKIDELLENSEDSNSEEQKKILFIRAGSGYDATKAKTADNNFVCVMLKELGTYNIAENASVLLDGLSLEEILTENPDFIFISTMGKEEAAIAYMDSLFSDSAWQELDAVKNGKYAYLPKELFQYKPNARWYEAYEYLADLLNESR